MRCLVAALILLFSLPAAAQDLDALFRDRMAAVEEACAETDEDRRDALLDEAIAAFRAMPVVRPELVRVRLELARAFFLKGEDGLARQHFVALHLVPRRIQDAATEASLLASVRQRWSGTAPDYRDLGVRLEVAHRLSPRVTVFAQASLHDRSHRARTHLDGPTSPAAVWSSGRSPAASATAVAGSAPTSP